MNSDSLFGGRLKEERERLGLSQASAGAVAGVSREMWGKYERGAMPGGEVLMSIAKAGFDMAYLFSYQHTASSAVAAMNQPKSAAAYQPPKSAEMNPPGVAVAAYLSREEAALLDNYRNSPPEAQAALKTTSAAFAQPKGKLKKAG